MDTRNGRKFETLVLVYVFGITTIMFVWFLVYGFGGINELWLDLVRGVNDFDWSSYLRPRKGALSAFSFPDHSG